MQAPAHAAAPAFPALAVLEYHLASYRRTWRGNVLSSFALPLLTLLSFGVSVGGYVNVGIDGAPYLDWVVPGLVASTAVNVAIGDSSWPVLGNFEWTKIYYAQAAGPLRVGDILAGHLGFVMFRVLISCAAFLGVAAAFGTLHSPWALASLPIVLLLGLSVAAPTFAYSSTIKIDGYLALLYRFAVIPMSLFAGVFFPVESLPAPLRAVAYASPLWHGVELCRAATLGIPTAWSVSGHLFYLAVWAGVGCALARVQFRRRLIV